MIDLILNAGFKSYSVIGGRPFVEPGIYLPFLAPQVVPSPCHWQARAAEESWLSSEVAAGWRGVEAGAGWRGVEADAGWRSSSSGTDWRQKKGCA